MYLSCIFSLPTTSLIDMIKIIRESKNRACLATAQCPKILKSSHYCDDLDLLLITTNA